MGIDISIWRARIGCFTQHRRHGGSSPVFPSLHFAPILTKLSSLHLFAIIFISLVIAGIEPNPGPGPTTKEQLDAIFGQLSLLSKDLASLRNDFSTRLTTMEAMIANNRLIVDDLRVEISTLKTDLADTKTKVASLPAATATSTPPTRTAPSTSSIPSVGDIAREISARELRRKNLVISGVLPNDAITDDDVLTGIFSSELHLDPVFTCKRVGRKVDHKIQLLLVEFASAAGRDSVLSAASNLRKSTTATIKNNVFISPDLTQTERNEQYVLRQECRARKSAGEDVIVRSGKVIPRPTAQATRPTYAATAATSAQ